MLTLSVTITYKFTRTFLRRVSISRLVITSVIYYWGIMIQPTYSTRASVSRLVNTTTEIYMVPARPSLRATRGANQLFWQGNIPDTSPVHHNVYERYFVYQGLEDAARQTRLGW